MIVRYVFASGRVIVAGYYDAPGTDATPAREMPFDNPPPTILVQEYVIGGGSRDVELRRTTDYYNGALVYREDGAP